MSKILIKGSGDEFDGKYIKNIDKVNQKIEFTNNSSEAYTRESGFYVDSEIEFLQFYFKDEYPCIKYAVPV